MYTGVAIFPTHDGIGPAEVARLAEERGHESLLFPEHTHIPAGRESPYPSGGDAWFRNYAPEGSLDRAAELPLGSRGPVERALDRYEAAVAEFHGE
jgi:hypothetical protein